MIDFRPMHNRVRDAVLFKAAFVIVLHAGVFTLLALLDFGFLGALPTLRELVPWGATTEPKIGFLSLLGGLSHPAHAWITVSGQGWRRDLVVIADPSELYCAVDAHKKLGGTLGEPLRSRVHDLTSAWKDEVIARAKHAGTPVRGVQKRSARCRCGSGETYEACCRGRLRESRGGPRWTEIADDLPWEFAPRPLLRAVN